jgi:hypothetical protein
LRISRFAEDELVHCPFQDIPFESPNSGFVAFCFDFGVQNAMLRVNNFGLGVQNSDIPAFNSEIGW